MMPSEGVATYLLLLKPGDLIVTWANDNTEDVMVQRGMTTAVGKGLADVIPFQEALDLANRVRRVAETGQTEQLNSSGFSVEGMRTSTRASLYRLPSGEVLIASEYVIENE